MNDQPEKKKDTKPLPDLQAIQPGQSRIAQPTETTEDQPPPIPQGDDMTDEITLQTLAAKVIMNKVEFDAFKEVVETKLNALLTPKQITEMIHDAIKQASHEFDSAVERIETIANGISTQFAANQTAHNSILVEMDTAKKSASARDAQLNILVSAVSIMAGYDIKDPQARKIGTSVTETANKAIEIANRAEDNVANMRIDAAAIAGQIKGWYNKAKIIEAQLARAEEADRIAEQERKKQAERQVAIDKRNKAFIDFATSVLKSKWAMGVVLSAATSIGTLGVFGEQIATFIRILFTGQPN